MMTTDVEQTGWLPEPVRDETPIVTGGAIVTVRLSPEEVTRMLAVASTLHEAVHVLAGRLPEPQLAPIDTTRTSKTSDR